MPYRIKEGERWWALKTRANFERTVEEQLRGRSLEVYLPTYRAMSRRTDRRKVISLPLFPGYLFVHTAMADFDTRVAVLRARGVVRIVGGPEGPEPVPDAEIESVMRMCASDRMVEPWGRLEVGKQVRIIAGGLAGVTGVVVNIQGKGRRIICNIELLGRAVAAELRPEDLEETGRFEGGG